MHNKHNWKLMFCYIRLQLSLYFVVLLDVQIWLSMDNFQISIFQKSTWNNGPATDRV